jgi:hypothetical protein
MLFVSILSLLVGLTSCKKSTKSDGPKYQLTEQTYLETEDLASKARAEFGSDYEICDWNDLLEDIAEIENICNELGIEDREVAFVTHDGNRWYNEQRHYYIERHNHNKPIGFLSHADIDNHFIDLGSWYNIRMPILCIRKD